MQRRGRSANGSTRAHRPFLRRSINSTPDWRSRNRSDADDFQRRRAVDSDLARRQDTFVQSLDAASRAIGERLDTGATDLLSNIMSVDMTLEAREASLRETIEASAARLDSDLARRQDGLAQTLDATTRAIGERLDTGAAAISSSVDQFDAKLGDRESALRQTIAESAGRLDSDLASARKACCNRSKRPRAPSAKSSTTARPISSPTSCLST